MNQQSTSAPANEASPRTGPLTARVRRRLGGWSPGNRDEQSADSSDVAVLDGATVPLSSDESDLPSETVDLQSGGATAPIAPEQTAPIEVANQSGEQTVSLPTASETVPLAAEASADAGGDQTVPLPTAADDGATVPLETDASSATVDLVDQRTAQIATTASTAELLRSVRLRESEFNPADSTVPLSDASTVSLDGDETVPLDSSSQQTATIDGERELSDLRERVASNPNDSDALFALSVALHRHGKRTEARETLTRLVAIYKERGQHAQAKRIMAMLRGPKTGPLGTDDLPSAKAKVTPGALTSRTETLPLQSMPTAQLARQQRPQSRLLTPPPTPEFVPESLAFTIPLPGEQFLPAEIRELVAQASADLQSNKLNAAFDLCLYSLALAPDYIPMHLRIAEIYAAQRLRRRARTQAETMLRLSEATGEKHHLWMIYRLLLHTADSDLPSLRRLVELLIEAGQTEQASFYASKLIQLLDAEGLSDEALTYSIRLCNLIPGDTRAALENAILLLKNGDRGSAVDRWEAAVAAGADPLIARSSMSAIMTAIHEDDHWKLLAEVTPALREHGNQDIVDAYIRTAAVETPTKTLEAGEGLLLSAAGDDRAKGLLAAAAGDRSGSAFARAVSAVCLTDLLKESGPPDEYVAAIRTAIQLMDLPAVASNPNWLGLLGRIPRYEDLSLELGEALLARQDAAGAVEVLKLAHSRSRHHGPVSDRLADAYFRMGQLGSALTVLDEMAVHYRSSGQLEAMAGVLRQMSQLAPNNIKVKSRLIDAYLQRGFVAEARAELVQRADLEERSGLIKDAVASLQRAADLTWTMGGSDETFALYGRMITLAPEDAGNRHALVNLYLQMGRLDEAAEHQRAVVDIAMKNESKHEAIAALHQVIGLTPDDASAYYQLGDLLSSIGEYHQAERVYKRLVLMNPNDAIAQAKATTMAALKEEAVAGG